MKKDKICWSCKKQIQNGTIVTCMIILFVCGLIWGNIIWG